MKFSSLAFAACTTAPILLALALPADELAFRPAANSDAAKTMKVDAEFSVTSLSGSMDGQPIPGEAIDMIKSKSVIMNMLIGVTEKYVETKDGRPTDLLRTFDKLKLDLEAGEESHEVEEFKDIEGKTVRFKWSEKEGSYEKSFHESKGEVDQLKELDADMDLRVLLPEKKVGKGDTWTIPADRLKTLFLPGGLATKTPSGKEEEIGEKIKKHIEDQLASALKEFKVLCTYKGSREEDGVKVGEIAFSFDGKGKLDLASLLEEIIESQKAQGIPEMDFNATVGLALKGEGTALWNQAAGHLHHFEMHATAGIDIDISVKMQQGDTPHEGSMTGAAEGKLNWDLSPTTK